MYTSDVIIYTSATDELEYRMQVCIDNISNWFIMNKLCINKTKSNAMVIGSKCQSKSFNLDDFTISVDSDKLLLAKQAKYFGLLVRNVLSQDDHILELCKKNVLLFSYVLLSKKNSPSCFTVYPKKYAHSFCFAVLCCGYTLTDFPISIRITSLALWQSNDCPSAIKATLINMDKYFMCIHYERLHNHNKAKHNKTVCIFLGIYCTS